MMGYPDTHIVG